MIKIIVKSVIGSRAQTQKSTKIQKTRSNHKDKSSYNVNLAIKHEARLVYTQFEIMKLKHKYIIGGESSY